MRYIPLASALSKALSDLRSDTSVFVAEDEEDSLRHHLHEHSQKESACMSECEVLAWLYGH